MALIIYQNQEEYQARFYAFSGAPDALGQLLKKDYQDEILLRKIFAHEKNIMSLNYTSLNNPTTPELTKWFDKDTVDKNKKLLNQSFYESSKGVPKADNPDQFWFKYCETHPYLYLYENSSWHFSAAGLNSKNPHWISVELAILVHEQIKNLIITEGNISHKENIANAIEFFNRIIKENPTAKPHLGKMVSHWHIQEKRDVFERCLCEHDLRALTTHVPSYQNKIKV